MKNLYILVLFMSLCCPYHFVKAEAPKVPSSQNDPMKPSIAEDEITRYEYLSPFGDYSKLDFIIRTNKKEYLPGEPIYVCFSVKNNSEEDVHINMFQQSRFFTHLWKLVDSKNEQPAWTRHGAKLSKSNEKQLDQNINFFGVSTGDFATPNSSKAKNTIYMT